MMPQKTMADNDLYIDFFCGMLDKNTQLTYLNRWLYLLSRSRSLWLGQRTPKSTVRQRVLLTSKMRMNLHVRKVLGLECKTAYECAPISRYYDHILTHWGLVTHIWVNGTDHYWLRFTYCGLVTWRHMATQIWINIDSGNGFLPGGTIPLPESMLACYQRCFVEIIFSGSFIRSAQELNPQHVFGY